MNAKIRGTINSIAKCCSSIAYNGVNLVASIFRMLILSRPNIAIKSNKYKFLRQHECCCVLANGPSLKSALENNKVKFDNCDVFCVNMFALTPDFYRIKPRFYFIVDGAFFHPIDERTKKQVDTLSGILMKVNWEMYLCISSSSLSGGILKILDNPNIKIIRWNTTTIDGFRGISNLLYKLKLGMPKCQTVTNFALTAAVDMEYRQVLLYGADHSWTRDLTVDDDNVVCYGDRHVYNTNLEVIKQKYTIAYLLRAYADMFDTHHKIEHYSQYMKCKIYNCTEGSFVDAYERLK